MQHSVKGKQVKDYVMGETIISGVDMQLVNAVKANQQHLVALVFDKKSLEQTSFIGYNNLIQENKNGVHPQYIEAVQTTNNIYLILEHIRRIDLQSDNPLKLLSSIVSFYHRLGQFKLDPTQIFVNDFEYLLYLPFYRKIQTSSKFYAQFHNKSVLGDILCQAFPTQIKNSVLQIFMKYIDQPQALERITAQIKQLKGQSLVFKEQETEQKQMEEPSDQQIYQLMSQVKLNPTFKQEAGVQFMRQSSKGKEGGDQKEIKGIMENVQSSMFAIKGIKPNTNKTKMEVKISQSKVTNNEFELYFKSYCQSLRFLKRSLKRFLQLYKNGFAGVISAFLLQTVITLRKAYLIKQLQQNNDVFELDINMKSVQTGKYISYLKKDLKSQAKLIAELKTVIENCNMPVKTYTILAPFLQDDLSQIDFNQLQTFTFFYFSALLKKRTSMSMNDIYLIEVMYILLHRNFQIVYFDSDFPHQWDQDYFDIKISLIQALLPNWNLK